MKFKILMPQKNSGKKNELVTIYKNTKGLYIAILRGIEVGLVKEVQSDNEILLDSCIEAKVSESFSDKFYFFAEA